MAALQIDKEELLALEAEGYVTIRPHKNESLVIVNYTPKCQFENKWEPLTKACRGLILDSHTYQVVARPPDKFFNLGDEKNTGPIDLDGQALVMDKADGSLGIIYQTWNDKWAVATRGSFHSDQAEHATERLQELYPHLDPHIGFTFFFEIVYPENRIVLAYEGLDDLILLGARENSTGDLYGPEGAAVLLVWRGPLVKTFDYETINEALQDVERPNAEGYVIRTADNVLVKVKQEDYLRIHRLRFDMTPHRIWEVMAAGDDINDLLAELPDEFHAELTSVRDKLESQYAKLQVDIRFEYARIEGIPERKDFAQAALKSPHRAALFALRDGKDINDYIWQQIRI